MSASADCVLGRIFSFILLQLTSLLCFCCQGYHGSLLAQDMGASQHSVLSVALTVTDSSMCPLWVACEVRQMRMEQWAHDPV